MKVLRLIFVNFLLFYFYVFILTCNAFAGKKDSVRVSNYKLIPLPVLSYNSDVGLNYGGILNLFYYGHKRRFFPDYKTNVYFELTSSSKGSGTARLSIDYKEILKNFRGVLDLGIMKERSLPFYGFENLTSKYISKYEDPHSSAYKSMLYFNMFRRMSYIRLGGYLDVWANRLKFFGDINFNKIDVGSPRARRFDPIMHSDTIVTVESLYGDMKSWGVINPEEAKGGYVNFVTAGVTFNTRKPVEVSPFRGIYAEMLLVGAPHFLFNKNDFVRLYVTYKHFVEVINKRLVFAYRVAASKRLYGNIPFYAKPFYYTSLKRFDALGGIKTVRGVDRDRIVADDFAFANFEMRLFATSFNMFSSLVNIVLYPYFDTGISHLEGYEDMLARIPENRKSDFNKSYSGVPFFSYGMGAAFVIDYNFVMNVSAGVPQYKDLGSVGIFLGLDYVF